MKHLPAILFIAAAVLCGSVSSPAQAAPILDFAVRVGCDFQQPERGLMDLHVLQGSTPLVLAMPKAGNTALTPDADTSVRMVIGPSETGSIYAVRTNYAIAGGGYAIDWPTIGTNSSGQAWFYTLLFDREGKTYWSGTGALYIDASTYTGPDGVDWIEYTIPNVGWANVVGDPADNAALVQYVEDHGGGSAEDTVARAGVSSNAADIAIMQTGKLDVATAATTYQPVGDYATGTPLYVETYLGTITGATITGGTVTTNSGVLEFTVEGGTGWANLAITGTGNAITNATAAGDTLTLERGTIEGGGGGGTSTNEVRAIRDEAFRPYTTLGLSGGTALVTRSSGQWVMIEADDGEVTLDVDVAAYTNSLEAIRHQICWVRGTNETYVIVTNNIDNTLFVDLPISTTNHLFLERRPGWPRFQIWQDFRY